MPSIDVDAVLIAIRVASYGTKLTVSAKCPECSEEHDYDIDLTGLLGQVKCPNYDQTVDVDGLKIKLRAQPYISVTQTNIVQFEEQKIAQALNDPDISDDVRNTRIKVSMKNLLDLNDKMLVDSTEYVETEDGTQVTDRAQITELYKNSPSTLTKKIEARLAEIAKEGALPMTQLNCSKCNKPYEVPLEFDYARFFATGS
jgi:hypothetical protein